MKANAPEKIYLFENPISNEPDDRWLSKRSDDNDIEYIRKDAFIEAVANWMSETLQTVSEIERPSSHHVESIPALGKITQTEFIEKFKKEIMFLLD